MRLSLVLFSTQTSSACLVPANGAPDVVKPGIGFCIKLGSEDAAVRLFPCVLDAFGDEDGDDDKSFSELLS